MRGYRDVFVLKVPEEIPSGRAVRSPKSRVVVTYRPAVPLRARNRG